MSTETPNVIDLQALAKAVADELERRQGPPQTRLWSCEDVAAFLGFSVSHTRNRIVSLPKFPVAIRIDGGLARWRPADVIAWADRQRDAA